MEIRNVTGQPQVLGGVHLPPDLWLRVPEQVRLGTAMAAWNMRIAEVRVTPDDPHALWQEEDGLHLFWQSPFSLADGYGTAAENMVWALKKLGVHVHARVCWFDASKAIHAQTRALLAERIPAPMKVGVCMSTPPDFPKLPTAYRVGYTMYEADDPLHVHPEWRHGCEHADLLVVPSGYCRDVFGRFYRRRIEVAPLVVHPDFYLAKRRVPKDTFTFVSYGTLSGRKGPLETMAAFLKAFPKDTYPHVRLAFKTRLGVFGWGHHQLPPNPDPARITIHDTGYGGVPDWSRGQLIDWLLGADALLFLSKGEGFGMPPREAMATGLPAIFTNHTGMAEVADARYAWPVRWKEEKDCPLGGVWRPADTDDAIDIMRYVVEHREDAYDKAVRGAEWFIREHGEEAAARRLLDVLEDIDPATAGQARPTREKAGAASVRAHAALFDAVKGAVPNGAPVLDVGFGTGIAYLALHRAGYEVYGVVEPGRMEEAAEVLRRFKVPVRLMEMPLRELSKQALKAKGWPEMRACVSVGVMQDRSYAEIPLLVRAMVGVAPTWFGVPSAFYPDLYADGAKQWRTLEWLDRLGAFERQATYYGKGRRYVMVQVAGEGADDGRRYGRIIDHVWRPTDAALALEGKA